MADVADEVTEGLDEEALDHLLTWVQDGVVARRQLLELGARPHDIRRMLRRRDLTVVHPGVYVNHTGPLTWVQRAWAAVLAHWPAALARESALPKPARNGPVHVAIDLRRTVRRVEGVVAHRTAGFQDRVSWLKAPPRTTLEHAAIDVAATKADIVEKFRVFADAAQTRETSADKIAQVLRARRGVADRRLLLELLDDLAAGACSVLEREYLLLERRHGLPTTPQDGVERQRPTEIRGRSAFQDVVHEKYLLVIELDGRAFHDNAAARDQDSLRDLETVVRSDRVTVRLTYGLVLRDGCRTVWAIALLLQRRGWKGTFVRCPDCPADLGSRSGAAR